MAKLVTHTCVKCSSTEAAFRKMDRFKPELNMTVLVQPYAIVCGGCGHYELFHTKVSVREDQWDDESGTLDLY